MLQAQRMEKMTVEWIVLCLVACLLFGTTEAATECKDESGNSVDWFYAVKIPKIPKDSDPTVDTGYAYLYGDSNKPTLSWITTRSLTQNRTGALAHTLTQVYAANKNTVAWIMYNDELLGSELTTYAHSKGVLAADASSGFWLVHSVPRFPVPPSDTPSYYYPSYETENAQSFLCVTYTKDAINTVADLFLINKPYVFSSNLPTNLVSVYPSIDFVLAKDWIKDAYATSSKLTSRSGVSFVAFAKNSAWAKDLYEDLVSVTFGQSMSIQTWREGTLTNLMPSYCSPAYKYNNINVLSLQAHAIDIAKSVTWSYTKDHSKWGITLSGGISCIGDINRMFSQSKRGGGTVCFTNPAVYQSMKSLILTEDTCN